MPLWLGYTILVIFFLLTTFLGTWAIREGGSFAFMTPTYWKKGADPSRPGSPRRDRIR